MSIWIRAICTQPIGPLNEIDMRAALDDDEIDLWAEAYDIADDAIADACVALRFEYPKPDVGDMQYGVDREISFERWSGEAAREEIDEMREMAEDADGDGIARVRDVLSHAVETVAFELKASHARDMGWPLALCAALELAKRGRGLVQADTSSDTWWDPETGEVVVEY